MAFKAGSRYEQPDEQGVVHFLRNIVGTDSAKYSGLKLLWQSGSIGSNVVASASKDLFVIQLSVVLNKYIISINF
jgi:predicted Zn-dependent peptidase